MIGVRKSRPLALVTIVLVSLLLVLTACGGGPGWSEVQAKAELADYLHREARSGPIAALQGGGGLSLVWESRLKDIEKATIDGWTAHYEGKGVWLVTGADIGEWYVFEDRTAPVSRKEPTPSPTP